jgi:hypothetical protein
LLDRAHYYLNHLKCPPPDLKFNSRNEIAFRKTDSTLYIGTAGAGSVGVGDTITDFHGSEVALWNDPSDLLKGVFNAVSPTGTIILESTGKGMGNYYHRTCMRAADGTSNYKMHFFSWTDAPEYRIKMGDEEAVQFLAALDEDLEEPKLLGLLDAEQLAWRRAKIIEMDYDLKGFKEQYPLTLDECFQGTGSSYFQKVNYQPDPRWHKSGEFTNFMVFGDHPKVGLTYVAGGDTGGGTGRDNSVLEIFCLEDMRQVGEWASNRLEPHIFVEKITPILTAFNNAYVNIERNNHGILTIRELTKAYNGASIHMSRPPEKEIKEFGKLADYGTYTSVKNRLGMIGSLRQAVGEEMVIHSPLLKDEMNSFVENDEGKIEAQQGCFDDRVMASALATWVMPKVLSRMGKRRKRTAKEIIQDPFSLDYILEELDVKYREQVSGE